MLSLACSPSDTSLSAFNNSNNTNKKPTLLCSQCSRRALRKQPPRLPCPKHPVPPRSDDVFEAEGAVAGQALALAPAAEVLAVRPLGVHVAHLHRAGAPGLLAALRQKAAVSAPGTGRTAPGRDGTGGPVLTWQVMSSTRYGL